MAVTYGPGLVGSLLVGLSFVKALSFRTGIPFVGVNHLEAHLLAIHLEHEVAFPYIALLASGGHTLLYCVRGVGDYRHLGGTRDDAAGEAYDKVAKMLGLGYPGGRAIDILAKSGDPKAIRFPRASLKSSAYEFSFSGIKTAVWHFLKSQARTIASAAGRYRGEFSGSHGRYAGHSRRSMQRGAIGVDRIVLSGGVAANSRLRENMKEKADAEGLQVFYPDAEILHRQRRDDRSDRLSLAEARPARRFSPQRRRRSDALKTIELFNGSKVQGIGVTLYEEVRAALRES